MYYDSIMPCNILTRKFILTEFFWKLTIISTVINGGRNPSDYERKKSIGSWKSNKVRHFQILKIKRKNIFEIQ